MNAALDWLLWPARDSLGLLLLDLVVKATVLLGCAWLVVALAQRASAAVRHRVWCLALGGLLLLPVLTWLLPGWRLPILPETQAEGGAAQLMLPTHGPTVGLQEPAQRDPLPDRLAAPGGVTPDVLAARWPENGPTAAEWATMPAAHPPTEAIAAQRSAPAAPGSSPALRSESARLGWVVDWPFWLGGLWFFGTALTLLPVLVGVVQNHLRGGAAEAAADRELADLLQELSRQLGVRRRVRLLVTRELLIPMTWGVLWPVVLFPHSWRQWTAQRRRLVLLHELAHVKRCDVAFQLLARVACAWYWWHPLAWYALRRLRIERELACDDCVLMAGQQPAEYARQLLDMAISHQARALPAAVAMAHGTSLEKRIHAMLDGARSHLPLNRAAAVSLLVGTALMVTAVAAVQPGTREPAPDARSEKPAQDAADKTTERPARASAANNNQSAVEGNVQEEVALQYEGTVVGPEGEPVAGAKLFFVYWIHGTPPGYTVEPLAVTDRQGRFAFSQKKSDFARDGDAEAWSYAALIATAEGFGFAYGRSVEFETTGQALAGLSAGRLENWKERLANRDGLLRLARDDVPISGQVVSIDGQPVAGARIGVDRLWWDEEGNLDSWEEAARAEKADFYSLRTHSTAIMNGPQLNSVFPAVETDAEGRFTLRGIGRERIVQLLIRGPGIETSEVKARTRKGEKVVVPHEWDSDYQDEIYFPADFVHVPGPSKPVAGRVTDADTGDPLAGVLVSAGQRGTFFAGGRDYLAALSDADGRYTLEGLPLGGDDRLYAFPPAASAYLPAGQSVDTRVDQGEVTRDFELKRGVLVRGQAIDDRTGKPAPGRVQYYAFRDNPHLEAYQGFSRAGIAHERRTDEHGRFEIAVLPGPGILTFMALDHTRYRRGLGGETITGPSDSASGEMKMFHTVPTVLSSYNEHLLRQIEPKADSEPIELTLKLTSGVDIVGRLLDPDGQPLSGGIASGHVQNAWYPIRGETFRIEGYYPDRARDLYFYHPQRDLGGYFRLEGEPPAEVVVTLQETGRVRGRLVDDSGGPIAGISLHGEGVPSENYGNAELRTATGEDGRFLVRGLLPGRKYSVHGRGDRVYGRVLTDVTVGAGQTRDVGDVTLQPPHAGRVLDAPGAAAAAASPAQPAQAAAEAATVTVRGRVLTPDDQPLASATVRARTGVWAMLEPVVGRDIEPPTTEVRTDAAGQFAISFSKQPFGDLSRFDRRWREIWKQTEIVALAPGYGPAWVKYEEIEAGQPVTLKLVHDLPVQGRVIDLEGRPIAGAIVKVGGPAAAPDEDLTPWLEAAKAGEVPWTLWKFTPRSIDPQVANIPSTVTTDADGRFTIRGIGRERHFTLVFQGENIAHRSVGVATRLMEPIDRLISPPPFAGTEPLYGAEFTFTAAPSRPIEGTVRDAATGGPLAGVAVESYKLAGYPYSNHRVLKTATDAQGRFRLVGMPKAGGNRLLVLPNDDQPYFMQEVDVPDPTGLGPATVDVQLHRGLWITGRVTDKLTGEPVHARLHYLPLRSNTYAQAIPEFDDNGNTHGDQLRYQTRADGSYRLVGLPGPAVVGAESVLRQYRQGVGLEQIDAPRYQKTEMLDTYRNPINPGPKWPNVLRQIDPRESAEEVTVDFEMDPGLAVRVVMVDPNGQPLSGVQVDGHTSRGGVETMEQSTFEAVNFGPGEQRTVVFHHAERNLGWVDRIRPPDDPSQAVTIRLEPCATVTGRLLHEDGTPYAGLNVLARVLPGEDFGKELPSVTTDGDGRFRFTIVPGCTYWLHAQGKGISLYGTIEDELAVQPGETKDLGDRTLNDEREFVSQTVADR